MKMDSTHEDGKFGPVVLELKNDYLMRRLISVTYKIYAAIGGFESLSVENMFEAYNKTLDLRIDFHKYPLLFYILAATSLVIFFAAVAAVLLGLEFWFRKTCLFKSRKRDSNYFGCRLILYLMLISFVIPFMFGVHVAFLGQRYMARGFLDDTGGLLSEIDLMSYRVNQSLHEESQSFVTNSIIKLYRDRSTIFNLDVKNIQKRYLTKFFAGSKFDAFRAADDIDFKIFFHFDFYKEVVREIMRTMLMYSYGQRDLYNDGYITETSIFRGFFYGLTKECFSRLKSFSKEYLSERGSGDPMRYIPTCYQLFDIFPSNLKGDAKTNSRFKKIDNIFDFVDIIKNDVKTDQIFRWGQFWNYYIGKIRSHIPQLNYEDGYFLRYSTFLVNYGFGRNATIRQFFRKVLIEDMSERYTQTKVGRNALEGFSTKLMEFSKVMQDKKESCVQLLNTTKTRVDALLDDIHNFFSLRDFLSQSLIVFFDLLFLLSVVIVLIILHHCVLAIFYTKPRFHPDAILGNFSTELHEDKEREFLAIKFTIDAAIIFVFLLVSANVVWFIAFYGGSLHFGLCRHIPQDTKKMFDQFKNISSDAASATILEKLTTLFYYCAEDHGTYGYDLGLISSLDFKEALIDLDEYLKLNQKLADRIKLFDFYELPYEFYSNYIMIVFGCSTLLDTDGKEITPDNMFTDHLYNAYVDDWPPNGRKKYTIEDFIKFSTPYAHDMTSDYMKEFKGFAAINAYLNMIKQLNFFFTMSNEDILSSLDRLQVRVIQLKQGLELIIRKYKAFQKNFRNIERFRKYLLEAHKKGYCNVIMNNETIKLGDAIKDIPFLFNKLTTEEQEIKNKFLEEFRRLLIATFRRSVDVSCKPMGTRMKKALLIFCDGVIDPMNVMGLGFFAMFISLVGMYAAVLGLAPLVSRDSLQRKTDFQRLVNSMFGLMTATDPMLERLSRAAKMASLFQGKSARPDKSVDNTSNAVMSKFESRHFLHPLLRHQQTKAFRRPGQIKPNREAVQWLLDSDEVKDFSGD